MVSFEEFRKIHVAPLFFSESVFLFYMKQRIETDSVD